MKYGCSAYVLTKGLHLDCCHCELGAMHYRVAPGCST
jgi:hypothetical protein